MNSDDSLPAPEPFQESSSTMGYWMLYVVLAGGVLFVANTRFYGCRGSTRSTKLEWETRQAEISQSMTAVTAAETGTPAKETE